MQGYRRSLHRLNVEATVSEAQFRQRSLLDEENPGKALPREIETKAFDLLVQLLAALIPVIESGERNE
jgi:hypothetical protein